MSLSPLDRTRASLDVFVESQLMFNRPPQAVDLGYSTLAVWNANKSRALPAMVVTRRLNCGTSAVKHFRRVTLHGDGECYLTVLVDGRQVLVNRRVVLRQGPASPATANLPRGTGGEWIVLEIVGQTLPDSVDIEWDPIN